jgi:hypothetical protein
MIAEEYSGRSWLFQRLKNGPHGQLVERYAVRLVKEGARSPWHLAVPQLGRRSPELDRGKIRPHQVHGGANERKQGGRRSSWRSRRRLELPLGRPPLSGSRRRLDDWGAVRADLLRPALVCAHPGKEAPRRRHPRTQGRWNCRHCGGRFGSIAAAPNTASTMLAAWRAPSGNITWLDGRWTVPI